MKIILSWYVSLEIVYANISCILQLFQLISNDVNGLDSL